MNQHYVGCLFSNVFLDRDQVFIKSDFTVRKPHPRTPHRVGNVL